MDSFSCLYGRSYRTNRASEIRLEENLRKKRSSTVQKPAAFKAKPAPNCPEPVSRYAMKKKCREKKPKGRNAVPFSGKGAKEKPTSVQIQKPKICQKQRNQTTPANTKIRGKTGTVKKQKSSQKKNNSLNLSHEDGSSDEFSSESDDSNQPAIRLEPSVHTSVERYPSEECTEEATVSNARRKFENRASQTLMKAYTQGEEELVKLQKALEHKKLLSEKLDKLIDEFYSLTYYYDMTNEGTTPNRSSSGND